MQELGCRICDEEENKLSVLATDFGWCQFSCKLFQWQVLALMEI